LNTFLLFISIAAIASAAIFIHLRFIKPWQSLRRDLEQMASGNFRIPAVQDEPGQYAETTRHVKRISELLLKLDRQIANEDLSLRGILSGMVEGILIIDRTQRITLVNEALLHFFSPGRSPIGRTVLEYFRRHELQHASERALAGGEPQQIELSFETITPKGTSTQRHFNIHVAALSPESSSLPQAVLLVFQDVTDVRNLEATRREFIANVSHEFRTPLAIIKGYVETLLDGAMEEPEMAERSLEAIQRNVQRLNLLIEDLLSISQMEGRARLLELDSVNLHELLLRVLENLKPTISATKARIEIEWPVEARVIEADSRRMEQVYLNLLTNALRYGDSGDLVLSITAKRDEHTIAIAIADNGPGIPLSAQPFIFDRFYRVHKDRSRDGGGTGLGLSIVKNIILAHGGTVSVESTPSQGATFHIRLPVSQNPSEPAA
jgi:two-component system phosphate regulon sensor histidine kinase PhoR